MNFDTISGLVASLGTMKYFPSDPAVKLALVDLMGEMAETEDQVRRLVKRVRTAYAEWPGEHEVRACFCNMFKPKDGINTYSTVYPDGIPAERPTVPQLAAGPMRQLPEGRSEVVIDDPQIAAAVEKSARKLKRLSVMTARDAAEWNATHFAKSLREIETPPRDRAELPGPTVQTITQGDIDAAVANLRERKASGAGGGEAA